MLSRKQPSSRGWIGPFVTTAISLAVALALVLNGRFIMDNLAFYQYRPSETIESFVSRSGMSSQGKFFFYASQPSLENAETFNKECGQAEATTAILGCYSQQKIYIYDVRDARLAGIREATAAHEMLHAAYERLSGSERQRVNQLLEAEFDKLAADKNLAERMAFYDRTEPGQRDNELHSVIGTEVSTLSPDLEAHYRRYFTDRAKVVALHSQYESIFTSLQAQADELNRQIDRLSAVIKSDTATYNKEVDTVQNDINDFNDRARRGDFGSQTEFTAQRRRLLSRVTALEDLRARINSNISEYNRLVAELNGIATQTEELNRSMDSSLTAPPSL